MAETSPASSIRAIRQDLAFALFFAFVILFAVGAISRYALLVVILDGLRAAFIMAPWALAGLWIAPLLRLGGMPLRWHVLLGCACGLGLASLAVLLLGSLGMLNRGMWIGVLVVLFAAGLIRLGVLLNAAYLRAKIFAPRPEMTPTNWRWALLLLCPFLIMALLAATTPAGLIWREEGFGYDILEYHLQVPKEYLSNGHISYLPHNVYASFPSNMEMLYLLAMTVYPDVREVTTIANMIHLGFAILSVFGAWIAGREWSREAGIASALLAGSMGWLVYLSGLAYVENGLLFFGMASLACLLRAHTPARKQSRPQPVASAPQAPAEAECSLRTAGGAEGRRHLRGIRWLGAAGIFAGLACGCKYTGFAFILLPLFLGVFLLSQETFRHRAMHALFFALVALTLVSPWLIKNLVNTGNPVFPLANHLFRGDPPGWTEEETAHWNAGHQPRGEEATVGGRLIALLNHSLLDSYQRLNLAALLLGPCGLFWRRLSRIDAALILVLLIQLIVWFTATHLFARFLVPLIIPSVFLAARSMPGESPARVRRGVMTFIAAACLWYASFAGRLMLREWPGALPASMLYEGRVAAYEHFGWVNELPADSKVLLLGEARAFYLAPSVDYWTTFNRNPFLEEIRSNLSSQQQTPTSGGLGMPGEVLLRWLRDQDYTHLMVNWAEVRRLTRTYGFAPRLTAEEIQQAIRSLEQVGLVRMQPRDGEEPPILLYVVPER